MRLGNLACLVTARLTTAHLLTTTYRAPSFGQGIAPAPRFRWPSGLHYHVPLRSGWAHTLISDLDGLGVCPGPACCRSRTCATGHRRDACQTRLAGYVPYLQAGPLHPHPDPDGPDSTTTPPFYPVGPTRSAWTRTSLVLTRTRPNQLPLTALRQGAHWRRRDACQTRPAVKPTTDRHQIREPPPCQGPSPRLSVIKQDSSHFGIRLIPMQAKDFPQNRSTPWPTMYASQPRNDLQGFGPIAVSPETASI